MALIAITDILTVDYPQIDQEHAEFIDLLNQLDNANNADFPALFQQLCQLTEQHFEQEKQLMQQYAFPAYADHNAEHQRVLGEFKQFKTRVDKGLLSFGRAFVKARLPQWLQLHVVTMDSALATHINLQRNIIAMQAQSQPASNFTII